MAPLHYAPDGAMMEGLGQDGFIHFFLQFIIPGAGPEKGFQIGQLCGEKAGFQLPVGREAETVAGPAEMVAHRADKTDLTRGPGESE